MSWGAYCRLHLGHMRLLAGAFTAYQVEKCRIDRRSSQIAIGIDSCPSAGFIAYSDDLAIDGQMIADAKPLLSFGCTSTSITSSLS